MSILKRRTKQKLADAVALLNSSKNLPLKLH